MEQIEASINRYLSALDTADQEDAATAPNKSGKLREKIASLKKRMEQLKEIATLVEATPDKQISLTDPDARSMATSGKGTGVVGYNVQTAVDAQHHLIVAHAVTNVGNDRGQLATMAKQAQTAMGHQDLEVIADRGYYKGEEILACHTAGMTPFVPKPLTSGSKAEGRFAVHVGRARHELICLLDHGLPGLSDQSQMHDRPGTAYQAVGTRGRAGHHATTPRSGTGKDGGSAGNGRTPVRHHQGLDGVNALSDQDAAQGQHGDEPPRTGLQSEARDEDPGGRAADGGHAGMRRRSSFA